MMLEEHESTEDFFNQVANPDDKQRDVINLYNDWAQNYDRVSYEPCFFMNIYVSLKIVLFC